MPIASGSLGACDYVTAPGGAGGLLFTDVLSLVALRAVTRYFHHRHEEPQLFDLISPVSLRDDCMSTQTGNQRVNKWFPFTFPLSAVEEDYKRVRASAAQTFGSNAETGQNMNIMLHQGMVQRSQLASATAPGPAFISNFFPLADHELSVGGARLLAHRMRHPLIPGERVKFAWSSYKGEVTLFLQSDPLVIDAEELLAATREAVDEVFKLLAGEARL